MFRFIIAILIIIPSAAFSQLQINKTKTHIKAEAGKKFAGNETISVTVSETDSSIVYKVTERGAAETNYIYNFDKSGKCSSEKTTTVCDSCFEKMLKTLLAEKKYRWKKINLNQYVSKYSAGVFLELQEANNTNSLTVFRLSLNKKMYKFLLKNK